MKRFASTVLIVLTLLTSSPANAADQDRRVPVRISNAGFTITALPLLAAKDWGVFKSNGLDVELIVMAASLAPAALSSGDIDYIAGVGPASVSATLTGCLLAPSGFRPTEFPIG